MSKKYELIAFVGAFVPTEVVIARSRFKRIIDLWAKYHLARKYKYTPMQIKSPGLDADGKEIRKWINTWETTEKKEDLEILGNNDGRCDVKEVKEDLMRFGEVVDLSEVTDERVLKEIEAKSVPQKKENLDDATQRLEQIRQEMEQKKRKARADDQRNKLILKP